MKEMAVHTWIKAQLKKKYGTNFLYIKAPAGIYSSRRGISDFVCCIYGYFVAIEVKSPTGKITLIQQNFLDEVNAAGGLGLCLVGKDTKILERIEVWLGEKMMISNSMHKDISVQTLKV